MGPGGNSCVGTSGRIWRLRHVAGPLKLHLASKAMRLTFLALNRMNLIAMHETNDFTRQDLCRFGHTCSLTRESPFRHEGRGAQPALSCRDSGDSGQCPKDCTASLRGRAWRAIADSDSALLRHHRGSRGPARRVRAANAAENPSQAKRARSRGRFRASRRIQAAGGLDAQAGPTVLAKAPACLACQDPIPSFVARTSMRDLDLPRWIIASPVAARPRN